MRRLDRRSLRERETRAADRSRARSRDSCSLGPSAPAEPGERVLLGEREVGTIGSACVSPVHGPIALALIRREAEPDQEVLVGDGAHPAVVVDPPFAP